MPMLVTFNKTSSVFEQAVAAHTQGRIQEADRLYTQLLKENPQNAEVLHMAGLLNCQAGNLGAGMQMIERSLALYPNPSAMSNLAEFMRITGRLAEGEQLCRKALSIQPQLTA